MSWEPTVAVDPQSPNIVAATQFVTVQISFDGGTSFTDQVQGATMMTCDDGVTQCFSNANCAAIGSGICYSGICPDNLTYCNSNAACAGNTGCSGFLGGDPSLAFDSQGRLFLTYLCRRPNVGRDVCTPPRCAAGSPRVRVPASDRCASVIESIRTCCSRRPKARRAALGPAASACTPTSLLECPRCKGRLRILAAIHPPENAKAILDCLGLPARAPPVAAAAHVGDAASPDC